MKPREEGVAEAKSRVRGVTYSMYGVESYQWGTKGTASGTRDVSDPTVLSPASNTTRKPYVPPTPMTDDPNRPYQGLDVPLG
jgi:hypothetical protein